MTWRFETYNQKLDRLKKWHPWFAWHPVTHNGRAYWLEWVARSGKWYFGSCRGTWVWRYRGLIKGEKLAKSLNFVWNEYNSFPNDPSFESEEKASTALAEFEKFKGEIE